MPWYDLQCDACDVFIEDVDVPTTERNNQPCPECQRPLRVAIPVVSVVGPMPSKPLIMGNARPGETGYEITSNAQLRKHYAETGERPAEPGEWQAKIDKAYDAAEAEAKSAGYRGVSEMKRETKRIRTQIKEEQNAR